MADEQDEKLNVNQLIINDDYEHPDENVEYVMENVLAVENPKRASNKAAYEALKEQWNSLLMNACSCLENEHKCTACHGENYQLQTNANYPELVLKCHQSQDLIYECSSLCQCSLDNCNNRLVQFGPRKHLEIIHSKQFGSHGVITTKIIPKGAFVCEYAGELLTMDMTNERLAHNTNNNKMNYILCLNELAQGMPKLTENCIKTIVDPSYRGNIGRYLNHSCAPNCQILSVRVDSIIPKIAIFTNRIINANEELCFNYGGDGGQKPKHLSKTPCLCGSTGCWQFLPSIQF